MEWSALLDEARGADRPTLLVHPDLGEPGSVALVSGSFDPPTVAHLALAGAALVHADRAVFVYSVRTISKEGVGPIPLPLLDEVERLAAVERMAEDRDGFAVGVASHGLLVDQARAARARWPSARLFLAMGSDKLFQLVNPKWYEDPPRAMHDLFELALVLYAVRAGHEEAVPDILSSPELWWWRSRFIPLPVSPRVAAVSSRMVRERIRAGMDVDALVPDAVRPLLPSR